MRRVRLFGDAPELVLRGNRFRQVEGRSSRIAARRARKFVYGLSVVNNQIVEPLR